MELYRKSYVDDILKWKNKHIIKVITGIRRCGKSTILKQFIQKIKEDKTINKNQLIVYDFNNQLVAEKYTWKILCKEIVDDANKNKVNYVFLDEIQEIKQFEKCLITLFEHKNLKFDIYVTGSNSTMFSSSLSTLLTGRNIEIKIYPFSFNEYYSFLKLNKKYIDTSKSDIFELYLKYGGMPIIFETFDNEQQTQIRLLKILDDTLKRDIRDRNQIRTFTEFNRFVNFAIQNIGEVFSPRKISNYLKSNNKSKTSHNTVDRYLSWLCESQLMYRIDFQEIKGKKLLDRTGKYYAVDVGLKNAQNKFIMKDYGKLLENVVFIELLRRGYEVNIGKFRDGREIDFITHKQKETTYVQITKQLNHSNTKREIGNLQLIRDSHKKVLLTNEKVDYVTDDGIKVINIIDWLLTYA